MDKNYPNKVSLPKSFSNNKNIRKYNMGSSVFSGLSTKIPVRKYHTESVKTYSKTSISVYSYLDQIDEIINNSSSLFEAQREIERS